MIYHRDFFVQFDHLCEQFVQVSLLVNPSNIPFLNDYPDLGRWNAFCVVLGKISRRYYGWGFATREHRRCGRCGFAA